MTPFLFKPYRLVAILLVGFCYSCTTVRPKAPQAEYVSQLTKVTEPSVFNIPVELPLTEVQSQINAQVQPVIYDDNSLDNNGGDNLIVKVSKRLPLQVTSTDGALNIVAPVKVYVKAGWKTEQFGIVIGKFEDTEFDLDVKFSTKIAVDQKWTVSTKTTNNGFNWVSKPVISLGGFKIPITSVVERVLNEQLPSLAKLIDNQVKNNLNVKPIVQKAWVDVQKPILVNPEYNAWLKIRPQEVVMTPISTKGNNLKLTFGFKAITETVLGSQPKEDENDQLPPLRILPTISEKFQVYLMSLASYDLLKKMASAQLLGKTFEDGKRKIKITALDIYGQNDKMVVAVDLEGSVKGKIFLMGKPAFDPETDELRFDEMEYSLETKNALIKAADWLAHGKFVKMMSPYLKVSVKDQMAEARRQIDLNLNKVIMKGVIMKGKLDMMKPDQLRVTPQGIQTLVNASGTLGLVIQGL